MTFGVYRFGMEDRFTNRQLFYFTLHQIIMVGVVALNIFINTFFFAEYFWFGWVALAGVLSVTLHGLLLWRWLKRLGYQRLDWLDVSKAPARLARRDKTFASISEEIAIKGHGALITQRVVIDGTVQGVGYRFWMLNEATKRQVRGWVRNCSDGTVEALWHGHADILNGLLIACRIGPPKAVVNNITVEDSDETNIPEDFQQLEDKILQ